jgi:hypothetical protein
VLIISSFNGKYYLKNIFHKGKGKYRYKNIFHNFLIENKHRREIGNKKRALLEPFLT